MKRSGGSGNGPGARTDVAALTQRLMDAGAATVAFDIVFSEPDRTSPAQLARRVKQQGGKADVLAALAKLPDNDAILADTFRNSNVALAFFLTHDGTGGQVEPKMGFGIVGSTPKTGEADYNGAIQPLPALRDAATGLGFVSLPPDSDGIVRKAPLISTENGKLVPALSLEALRAAFQTQSVIVKSSDASGELGSGSNVISLKVGDAEVPTTKSGQLYMYYTAPHPERIVPAWKVLTGALSPDEMKRNFQGQVVFIGTSAQGLYDLKSTPLAPSELGVVVHAQVLEQIITHTFLTQPDWGRGTEVGALFLLGLIMALSLPWLGATRGAILGLVMVGGMLIGSCEAFSRARFLLDPTYPIHGLILVYLVETALT